MLNKRFGFENKADACLYEFDGQGGDGGRDSLAGLAGLAINIEIYLQLAWQWTVPV